MRTFHYSLLEENQKEKKQFYTEEMMLILTKAHKARDLKKTYAYDAKMLKTIQKQIDATKKYFIHPVIIQTHHAETFLKTAYNDPTTRKILSSSFCIGNPNSQEDFTQRILNSVVI